MANPTTQVPMSFGGYDRDQDTRDWPLNPSNTSDTFYTGELLGFNPSTGYAGHLDDSQVWVYLGNKISDTKRLQSDTPTRDFFDRARWTRFIDFPLTAASSTPALPTNFGDLAYAADSGHVQLSTSGLTNNNIVGMVVDIGRYASVGGVGGGIISLTGTGSPNSVRIAPPQPGVLLGLAVIGIPGPGAVGAAAKSGLITLGAGAACGTGAAVAGGAGGPLTITTGAGGAQTVASATAAGGAGGSLTITLGAGGNASGTTSTGNGGAGGSFVVTCGAGGTTIGGAVGVGGNMQLTAGTNPLAGTPAMVIAATDTPTAGVTDGFTGAIRLAPVLAGAQTITRHNYMDVLNPTGAATITDAAVMRFNAAAGTHKAVDAGTTKTSPGTVTQWIKCNVNGVIAYIPSYSSKTS